MKANDYVTAPVLQTSFSSNKNRDFETKSCVFCFYLLAAIMNIKVIELFMSKTKSINAVNINAIIAENSIMRFFLFYFTMFSFFKNRHGSFLS